MHLGRVLALALPLAAFAAPNAQAAQAPEAEAAKEEEAPDPEDEAAKEAARKLVREANASFKAGDYMGAIGLYKLAMARRPAPKLHYNIAVCHERLMSAAETPEDGQRHADLAIESYNNYLRENPRAGDRMRPFGMKGSKKLSDIFIDKKIPLRRRDKALIIADQKQIIWLVGVTTAETTRVTADAEKVLKITINPE